MARRVAVTFGEPAKVGPYQDAIRAAGLEPALNPLSLDGLDGLLLTGGTDVDPALYEQSPHPATQQPDRARDALEMRLLREALERDLPILAICRGLQLFNVAHGGTLNQHIDNHAVRSTDPCVDAHHVDVGADSQLGSIIGTGVKPVNSRHHQSVDAVGNGLRVAAVAPDGVVEALERPDRSFALAVQWHAEDRCLADARDRRLFEAFAEAVRRHASTEQ